MERDMHHSGPEAVFLLLVKASNRKLVQELVATGVDFVVVGSTALAFHGLIQARGLHASHRLYVASLFARQLVKPSGLHKRPHKK
jgi:hypothetical protein